MMVLSWRSEPRRLSVPSISEVDIVGGPITGYPFSTRVMNVLSLMKIFKSWWKCRLDYVRRQVDGMDKSESCH